MPPAFAQLGLRLGRTSAMLAMTWIACSAARAQGPEQLPSVPALLENVKSPDLAVREQATSDLATRPDLTLATLEEYLKRGGLTSEQHLRLTNAALYRFEHTERAALGVQFTGFDSTVIQALLPGFPAAQVLQAHDEIIEIDGETVSRTGATPNGAPQAGAANGVRGVIFSHEPGDIVPVTVKRAGKMVPLKIALGRYAALHGLEPTSFDLLEGWAIRSKKYAQAPAEAIASPLSAAEWKAAGAHTNDDLLGEPTATPGVVIGGEPHGGRPRSLYTLSTIEPQIQPDGQFAILTRLTPAGAVVRQVVTMADQQYAQVLTILLRQREHSITELNQLVQTLQNPRLTAPEQFKIQNRMGQISAQIAQLDQQMIDYRRKYETQKKQPETPENPAPPVMPDKP